MRDWWVNHKQTFRHEFQGRYIWSIAPGIALTFVVACTAGCGQSQRPQAQVGELTNGIRVAVVHFPTSTNVSVFTYTPMGLAGDGPGHAQWAHLVEHLVIRTTVPGDLVHANAETLADHMRLDTYGAVADWEEWLSHHRRWIEGTPFAEASLQAEKPRVVSECEMTARYFATHKFAVAAWAQGLRHGEAHVALKGDVLGAGLGGVQALRDEHFAVPGEITVCVVGGVEAATALAVVQKQLEGLRLKGTPTKKVKPRSGDFNLTWDLDARHLLVTWPIPGYADKDYAPLMVAGQLLNMQLATALDLKARVGMAFSGADLITPEGTFFYISASLRPGASAEDVRKQLLGQLDQLAAGSPLGHATMFAKQLAFSLTQVQDPAALKSSLPPGMTSGMLEGNLGLMFGLNVHRYGARRESLAQDLSSTTAGKVTQAVQKHLSDAHRSVCTISQAQR